VRAHVLHHQRTHRVALDRREQVAAALEGGQARARDQAHRGLGVGKALQAVVARVVTGKPPASFP